MVEKDMKAEASKLKTLAGIYEKLAIENRQTLREKMSLVTEVKQATTLLA